MYVHAYRQTRLSSETDPRVKVPGNLGLTRTSTSVRRGDPTDERREQALIESPGGGCGNQPIALYPLRHGMSKGGEKRDHLFFAPPDDTSTPSDTGSVVLCAFGHNHQEMQAYADLFLLSNRNTIGLERIWSLNVVIVCPNMMPTLEGSLMYDETKWYAEITLRCDLSQNERLMAWVLTHECFELKDWRTGSVFQDLSQFLQQEYDGGQIEANTFQIVEAQYLQRYLKARNQEIEQRVYEYLGIYRPTPLTNPFLPLAGQPPQSSARTVPLGESGEQHPDSPEIRTAGNDTEEQEE